MSRSALGIDLGGTRIKAGRVTEEGRVTASASSLTPGSLEALRETVVRLTEGLTHPSEEPLAGAGIGCKGIINPQTTRVETLPGTMSYLQGTVLADLVTPALGPGIPIAADNDARAAMAGEQAWGAARNCRYAIMLTLGTGVGGAAVVEGKLLRGYGGVGGHLGHITMDPDGPACICGNHGCLETYFSAHAIEVEAFSVAHRGCSSELTVLFRRDPAALTCEAVFRAAANGDELATRIVERAIHTLGAGLAGLVHMFDPEVVIIGGQIAEVGEPLLAALRKEVAWRTRWLVRREISIVVPQVADQAGIRGAAALAFRS